MNARLLTAVLALLLIPILGISQDYKMIWQKGIQYSSNSPFIDSTAYQYQYQTQGVMGDFLPTTEISYYQIDAYSVPTPHVYFAKSYYHEGGMDSNQNIQYTMKLDYYRDFNFQGLIQNDYKHYYNTPPNTGDRKSYEYLQNGLIDKEITYQYFDDFNNNNVYSYRTFFYDQNQRAIEIRTYVDIGSQEYERESRTYFSNGNISKIETSGVYSFGAIVRSRKRNIYQNNLLKFSHFWISTSSDSTRTEYFWDNGKIVEERLHQYSNGVLNPTPSYTIKYTFQNGKLIQKSWYNSNQVLVNESEYTYFNDRLLSDVFEFKYQNGNKILTRERHFEYAEPALSIHEDNTELDIKLFPNPTNSQVFLTNNLWDKIELYDSRGLLVLELNHKEKFIDLSPYENGLYFLSVYFGEQKILKKILKN